MPPPEAKIRSGEPSVELGLLYSTALLGLIGRLKRISSMLPGSTTLVTCVGGSVMVTVETVGLDRGLPTLGFSSVTVKVRLPV